MRKREWKRGRRCRCGKKHNLTNYLREYGDLLVVDVRQRFKIERMHKAMCRRNQHGSFLIKILNDSV